MPSITLEFTEEQLDCVLSTLESALRNGLPAFAEHHRGLAFIEAAEKSRPHEFSYDVAQVAPIYRQLVQHWTKPNTPVASCHSPEDQIYFAREGILPG